MSKFEPGNINNYAYGFQDATAGIDDGKKAVRLQYPAHPEDELYMRGWFSGLRFLQDEILEEQIATIRAAKRKRTKELKHKWFELAQEKGWNNPDQFPL